MKSRANERRLLILSCSRKKKTTSQLLPALERYDGPSFRVARKFIDEGFGCLDTTGRDDMIQELNRPQEQLSRILLVSHQEEFARAFSNGYAIALIDGASQISLK
jgi:exonuclease SbcC